MRRLKWFVWLMLPLWTMTAWGQMKEAFSDGDFTRNPEWIGDTNHFKVIDSPFDRNNKELQLNGLPSSARSYLSTVSTRCLDTEWEFRVRINHNPSRDNHAIFYLCADNPNLLSPNLHGYYLRIGHTNDNLVLFKQEGEVHTPIIEGVKGRTNSSTVDMRIRVSCDASGRWRVSSKSSKATDYISEPTDGVSRMNFSPSHLGLVCVYTKTYNSHFFFDDILVTEGSSSGGDTPDPGDTTPPKVVRIATISDRQLTVVFDEPIRTTHAIFSVLYWEQNADSFRLAPDQREITVYFPQSFPEDETLTLSIFGIVDLAGNLLPAATYSFSYQPESPPPLSVRSGEVVFSEIMANPRGAIGLPEVEYVELYNRTNRLIALSDLSFIYDTRQISLPKYALKAGEYVVLCAVKGADSLRLLPNVVGVIGFPVLANAGKRLRLTNNEEELVASVEYDESWYGDNKKKQGGWSLECIDLNNLSGKASNWIASVDPSGGTPGRINSVVGVEADPTPPAIRSAEWLHGDSIRIEFTQSMQIATLSDINNYRIEPNIGLDHINIDDPLGEWIELVFADPLPADGNLVIRLPGIRSSSGLPLPDAENMVSFRSGGWVTDDVPNASTELMLESDVLSVSAVGYDNILRLNYRFDTNGYSANIRVFDLNGHLIALPANNQPMETGGQFTWSLSEANLSSTQRGLFILHIEYYKEGAPPGVKKFPFVINP